MPVATKIEQRPPVLMALPHSGVNVREYYGMHFQGALFPLTASAESCMAGAGWGCAARAAGGWGRFDDLAADRTARAAARVFAHHVVCAAPGPHAAGTSGRCGFSQHFNVVLWPLPLAAGMILVLFFGCGWAWRRANSSRW